MPMTIEELPSTQLTHRTAQQHTAYLVREALAVTQRAATPDEDTTTELVSSLSSKKLVHPSTRTRNLVDCHYTALLRLLQHSHQKGAYPHVLAEVIRRSVWKEDRERFHSALCVLQDLHLDDDISWTPYMETVCAICDSETAIAPMVPDYSDEDGRKVDLFGLVFGTTTAVVVLFLCMRLFGWLMGASEGVHGPGESFGPGSGPFLGPHGPH